MKLTLWCKQRGVYFGGEDYPEDFFNSAEDIKEFLLEYHSCDLTQCEIKQFGKMNIENICSVFEWEVRRVA